MVPEVAMEMKPKWMTQRPPLWVAAAVSLGLVALWGVIRLYLFGQISFPLTFIVPLLVCLWTRRRSLLWGMTGAFAAMASLKAFWLKAGGQPLGGEDWAAYSATMISLLMGAAAIHLILALRDRLDERQAALEQANEELMAREEEIGQQNEELRGQTEELEAQSQELEAQAEELRAANEELSRRERMLQRLLESARALAGEEEVMEEICRAGLELIDGDAVAAAVVVKEGDEAVVRARVGFGPQGPARLRWPIDQSLAALVMERGKTGYVEDIAQRPDLQIPQMAGGALRSTLAAPLSVKGAPVGAVEFYATRAQAWTEEQFRLAEWVAGHCAVVLEIIGLHKRLHAKSERLRNHLENTPLGVVEWDAAHRITRWTPAAERIFGFGASEVLGKPVEELHWIHEEDAEAVGQLMADMLAGRRPRTIHVNRNYRKDGSVAWCQWYNSALWGEGGELISVLSMVLDVSQQKEAEAELEQAKAIAEQANSAKDQFLAILSHELRTPLTPVLLAAQELEIDPDLPPSLGERMGMIRRNVELEARLIDDLLDLTRITRGKLELRREVTEVHAVLTHAVETCCTPQIEARGLRIETELGAEHSRVWGDPSRLQQVFWNVINNALKFTPDGGQVRIRTWIGERGRGGTGEWGNGGMGERGRSGEPANRRIGEETSDLAALSIENRKSKVDNSYDSVLFIEIADTGSGIEAELLPRLFTAFEQGGVGTTRKYGGLGLGLAISRAILEMHGGSIRAQSDGKDCGATFIIELPLIVAPVAEPVRIVPSRPRPANGSAHTKRRLLLVEDHPDTARTIGRLLELSGYEVLVAHSVDGALKRLAAGEGAIDLLLSDLGLPDGTGHELMQQARDRYGLKGIALSGYGTEEDLRKSAEAGFAQHLTKPVNFNHLEAAIARVLEA